MPQLRIDFDEHGPTLADGVRCYAGVTALPNTSPKRLYDWISKSEFWKLSGTKEGSPIGKGTLVFDLKEGRIEK